MSPNVAQSTYTVALATFAAAVVFGAPAEAAKKPAKRKQEIVCFKKSGKKVCRPRRKPAKPTPYVPRVPLAQLTESAPQPAAPQADPGASSPINPTTPANQAAIPVQAPPPECASTSPWVGYTAEDVDGVFRLTGKRTCVPGPNVMFQLRNIDAQEHNLHLEGQGEVIGDVEPGATKEAGATLAAGSYRLFCAIEGHETMSRTLTVTG